MRHSTYCQQTKKLYMNRLSTLALALLFTGAMPSFSQQMVKLSGLERFAHPGSRALINVPGMRRHTAAQRQFEAANLPMAKVAPTQSGSQPLQSVTSPGFGYITGPDGTQWYYTQDFETAKVGYSTVYTRSHVTVYDSEHQKAGEFTVDIPAEQMVNQIEVYGSVTEKFFDRDANSKEVMVSLHYTTPDYTGGYLTYVYNLKGERVAEYNETGMLFDASEKWNTYTRLLMPHVTVGEDGTYYTDIDVLAPPSYGEDAPKVEHTFRVNEELYNYSFGSYFNAYVADGKPYYVLAYYEQPYTEGYDSETFEMIVRPNNRYIIQTYDKNYKLVDELAIPIEKPEGALYRFASFGLMSDFDLSDGYFTPKGERAYVISFSDYYTTSDSELYDFVVYDSKGNKLKTICQHATENQWFQLSPVKGHSDQWAFLQVEGDQQQIQMVDLPSGEKATLLPADIDGDPITTTLDRFGKDGSYQYAIKLATADEDDAGNTIARIGWYTPDLRLDHITNFNLGQGGEYFTPLINSQTLNPYLFDTDDELEYIYIAKKRQAEGDAIENVLEVANEDGSVLRSFGNVGNWKVRNPAVLDMSTTKQQLMVGMYNDNDQEYRLDFYDLPFSKFNQGGDGTPEKPYLVSTVGDLQQMSKDKKASYKLAADIDLGKCNNGWTPLESFSGELDGANHAIAHMSLSSTASNVGFFGTMGSGAKVRNLVFSQPQVEVNAANSHVGVVAGEAFSDTLTNVHVIDARIYAQGNEEAAATVGGLVGYAAYFSVLQGNSFKGDINLPNAGVLGGIVGETYTSTVADANVVRGTLTGQQAVGGVVGSTYTGCEFTNNRVEASLTGVNNIGGIVGDNTGRAAVKHNVASGSITSVGTPRWGGRALGGLVGYMESDWSSSPLKLISQNVAGMDINMPAPEEGDEADQTIHRIVGQTIANEEYEDDEEPQTEQGLSENLGLSTVTIGGESVAASNNAGVEGETAELQSLTREKLSAMGFAFGTEVEAPWKETAALPTLYFDNMALALSLDQTSLQLGVDEEKTLNVSLYGADASDLTVTSSAPDVVEATLSVSADGSAQVRLKGKGQGEAVVTVAAGNLTAECTVTCLPTGIGQAEAGANAPVINVSAGCITAQGAAGLRVYNAAGQLVATQAANAVPTSRLAAGTYVVVAQAANGSTSTAKVVVK